MGVLDSVVERIRASLRAFVLGPGVVDRHAMVHGQDSDTFNPAEYGDYLATSNGVYVCATGRAQLLSSLPLKAIKLAANGDRLEVTSGQLRALLSKVNPFWTFTRLIEMTELSLCLWGEAFWFLERGAAGTLTPREIWWGRPDRVKVVPDPVSYVKGFLYRPATGGQDIAFTPGEVIWFRYPNPLDEFRGLSPLAAARLAADYASAAMKSNAALFTNGLQLGGVLVPKSPATYTPEQAEELVELLDRRLKGADKAHRWAVLRYEAELKAAGVTPKEADFLGGLKMALEDIARAYKWPLDLIGGQRTYENYNAALRAAWTHCVIPEARFLATDLTEQLVPLFPKEADLVEFDTSGVDVLQEAEAERWTRAREQIQVGAQTINEWRETQGLQSTPWGDAWWAPAGLAPVTTAERPALPAPDMSADMDDESSGAEPPDETERGHRAGARRDALDYGGAEHRRLWDRWLGRATKAEQALGKVVAELLRRQKESVLAKLKSGRGQRGLEDEPFDLKEWIRKFRTDVRPVIRRVIQAAGDDALADLGLTIAFDVEDPRVVRFLEARVQRFAREVNQTTWEQLQAALAEGVQAGESIDELAERVEAVMGDRIASSGETIARTEVVGANNGGTLEAWRQSDVVDEKVWLAALDDRTRDSHRDAHGQAVGIDDDFSVGDAQGPAPGQMGEASEDINCRCTMTARISEERRRLKFGANGHQEATYA